MDGKDEEVASSESKRAKAIDKNSKDTVCLDQSSDAHGDHNKLIHIDSRIILAFQMFEGVRSNDSIQKKTGLSWWFEFNNWENRKTYLDKWLNPLRPEFLTVRKDGSLTFWGLKTLWVVCHFRAAWEHLKEMFCKVQLTSFLL